MEWTKRHSETEPQRNTGRETRDTGDNNLREKAECETGWENIKRKPSENEVTGEDLERTRDRREPRAAQDELDQHAAVLSSRRPRIKTRGARGGVGPGRGPPRGSPTQSYKFK